MDFLKPKGNINENDNIINQQNNTQNSNIKEEKSEKDVKCKQLFKDNIVAIASSISKESTDFTNFRLASKKWNAMGLISMKPTIKDLKEMENLISQLDKDKYGEVIKNCQEILKKENTIVNLKFEVENSAIEMRNALIKELRKVEDYDIKKLYNYCFDKNLIDKNKNCSYLLKSIIIVKIEKGVPNLLNMIKAFRRDDNSLLEDRIDEIAYDIADFDLCEYFDDLVEKIRFNTNDTIFIERYITILIDDNKFNEMEKIVDKLAPGELLSLVEKILPEKNEEVSNEMVVNDIVYFNLENYFDKLIEKKLLDTESKFYKAEIAKNYIIKLIDKKKFNEVKKIVDSLNLRDQLQVVNEIWSKRNKEKVISGLEKTGELIIPTDKTFDNVVDLYDYFDELVEKAVLKNPNRTSLDLAGSYIIRLFNEKKYNKIEKFANTLTPQDLSQIVAFIWKEKKENEEMSNFDGIMEILINTNAKTSWEFYRNFFQEEYEPWDGVLEKLLEIPSWKPFTNSIIFKDTLEYKLSKIDDEFKIMSKVIGQLDKDKYDSIIKKFQKVLKEENNKLTKKYEKILEKDTIVESSIEFSNPTNEVRSILIEEMRKVDDDDIVKLYDYCCDKNFIYGKNCSDLLKSIVIVMLEKDLAYISTSKIKIDTKQIGKIVDDVVDFGLHEYFGKLIEKTTLSGIMEFNTRHFAKSVIIKLFHENKIDEIRKFVDILTLDQFGKVVAEIWYEVNKDDFKEIMGKFVDTKIETSEEFYKALNNSIYLDDKGVIMGAFLEIPSWKGYKLL